MTTYLIPVSFCGTRRTPMEYKVLSRKQDLRFNFCKIHSKHIVNAAHLIMTIGLYKPMIKGDRIILPNGKIAGKFYNEVYKL